MFNIQQVIMERPSYKGNSPSAPGSASHSALFMKDVFFFSEYLVYTHRRTCRGIFGKLYIKLLLIRQIVEFAFAAFVIFHFSKIYRAYHKIVLLIVSVQ